MRVMISMLLIAMLVSPASALMVERDITNDLVVTKKFLTKKQSNKLLGDWKITTENNEVFFLRVTQVRKTSKTLRSFVYSVANSSGTVTDEGLLGYISGKQIFFSITFLNGYSILTNASINKNVTRITGVETFNQDRECRDSGLIDINSGFPIIECIIGTTGIGAISTFVMEKI